jgi:serine/threonine protein phosphatase PrpC
VASGSRRTLSAGRTDTGRRRPYNEDAFVADDDLSLYLVGDGVGGCASGEVASSESVAIVHSWVGRWRETIEAFVQQPSADGEMRVGALLKGAVDLACRIVFGMGQADPTMRGMSSTLSSVLCAGRVGFISHVGDSRVYLSRGARCIQLTDDHTLANERRKLGLAAAPGLGRNVITRSVGHEPSVEVDSMAVPIQEGDRFLICSDGLHGYLQDGELDQLVAGQVSEVTDRLVDLANRRGGHDNITVVVCDVLAD